MSPVITLLYQYPAEGSASNQILYPRGDRSCSWDYLFIHWTQFVLKLRLPDWYRGLKRGGKLRSPMSTSSQTAHLIEHLHWWRTQSASVQSLLNKLSKNAKERTTKDATNPTLGEVSQPSFSLHFCYSKHCQIVTNTVKLKQLLCTGRNPEI